MVLPLLSCLRTHHSWPSHQRLLHSETLRLRSDRWNQENRSNGRPWTLSDKDVLVVSRAMVHAVVCCALCCHSLISTQCATHYVQCVAGVLHVLMAMYLAGVLHVLLSVRFSCWLTLALGAGSVSPSLSK